MPPSFVAQTDQIEDAMSKAKAPTKTALCFFCQRRFSRIRLTKEHVFGDWLIRRANLERAKLTFPNKSSTRYSALVVPACTKCNTTFGSRFENEINSILDNIELHEEELVTNAVPTDMLVSFDDSARMKITLWLQKLLVGILYFEAHLENVPPSTMRVVRAGLKKSLMFRNTCRSILVGSGFNLPATLLVFELSGPGAEDFDFLDSFDPPAVGLKIDRKFFYVAISDGQLTNNYLHGQGLARLRADVLANRFGTVSHLMAFAYALATTRNLPTSPKFLYSDDQIVNMSNTGMGPPPRINTKQVTADANAIYRQLCSQRNIPLL